TLTDTHRAMLSGQSGDGRATAMRIVVEAARLLGAQRLIPISSAHIDGCLYHGDSGTAFAEMLVTRGAQVAVPSTLNVGALDLRTPGTVALAGHTRDMALRMMNAFVALGCQQTWTCAPYQAGHTPDFGAQVVWGESNAVAFCNSVLGARTNRYGDFLDIACAIAGYAPACGLHLDENRQAQLVFSTAQVPDRLKAQDTFWPVMGALVGARAGSAIPAVTGLADHATPDRLKAFGAAAASAGAVALFHIIGATPEAPSLDAVAPESVAALTHVQVTLADLRTVRQKLSTATGETVDAVAVGSPHCSLAECEAFADLLGDRRVQLPCYLNTGRHIEVAPGGAAVLKQLADHGVTVVRDTCIVVTPILRSTGGTLLTNSGKFAHYAPGTIGMDVVFGTLSDCVETAVSGHLQLDETPWH
ncbi:MAG: aconitase X catalytic domain-containing protein, partial [Pseudomonadota bacterium]